MSKVKVCDAIMGSGKTSAAINYMNDHPDKRYIYITPYLEEATRIRLACPSLSFIEPDDKNTPFKSKTDHSAWLIKHGQNIASTHSAFDNYTEEMLNDISERHYTLFVDESLTSMRKHDASNTDIENHKTCGYIELDNGMCRLTGKIYDGNYPEVKAFLKSLSVKDLIQTEDSGGNHFYYWTLPSSFISAFDDVIVMTYMFEGQGLYYFFKIMGVDYERIGVRVGSDGSYHFGEYGVYVPDYVYNVRDKIKIIDSKINRIGEKREALSKGWYERELEGDGCRRLDKDMYNYYHNIVKGNNLNNRLIGAYTGECLAANFIKHNRYSKSSIAFNARATNKHSDKKFLAYIVNPFMDVSIKNFYLARGMDVDENRYSLSTLIQWLWRSAIRKGEDVTLWLPSSRMRALLRNWMNNVGEGVIV